MHNLKNISVQIPRNKLTVVTGVSGSGKSSLAFDTLFAEGQRRYVESLSSYARQFMGRMEKPAVDEISGLTPSIAIEQKVLSNNTRSTVATSSDLYEYLKLLYTRFGKTISPISGNEVRSHNVADVIQFIEKLEKSTKFMIVFDAKILSANELKVYMQKGYSRIFNNNALRKIEQVVIEDIQIESIGQIIVDRLLVDNEDEDFKKRLADSAENAFWEGNGEMHVLVLNNDAKHWVRKTFNNRFELDGVQFEKPSLNFLSFNNPYGACKVCEGFGNVIDIDPELVIPNPQLSIAEGAVSPWRSPSMKLYHDRFLNQVIDLDFPIHKPYALLNQKQKDILWHGKLDGQICINSFFEDLTRKSYKIQYRVLLSKYRGKTICKSCNGTRLRKEVKNIFLVPQNKKQTHLIEILEMTISEANLYFQDIKMSQNVSKSTRVLIDEIKSRLYFLDTIGLGYLGLSRVSNTLSGGESQRIKIAYSLGSNLTGSTYVLDEPSIGLHPKDSEKLIQVLKKLKDLQNTVIVVEHDEDIILEADYLIDIGPQAGTLGGEVVFSGTSNAIKKSNTLTSQYLNKDLQIELPKHRRKWSNKIICKNARQNNLKGIDVAFPLNTLTVVAGVSGSGKTTLVKQTLVPLLTKAVTEQNYFASARVGQISGDLKLISQIEIVDQNPIGRSSRSNPVTYVKAYDGIRELFASQPAAKVGGLKPKDFSFNVDGGRCDRCKGEGEEVIEMQFIADIHLMCEECKGKRFKRHVLDVTFKGKTIFDVLLLSVDEAIDFFGEQHSILKKLKPLQDVGLGYIALGQSSNTLSGGEAQRVKLASYLISTSTKDHKFFVFDEPTTGLHFHDIKKLLKAFNQLVDEGNTIVVVEHNLDVIKCADWLIEMGPDAGDKGGQLVFEGIPEDLANQNTETAKFLKKKM